MNTDDYEGHDMHRIIIDKSGVNHSYVIYTNKHGGKDSMYVNDATAKLIAAAPDLLAEVKRLQGQLRGMLLAYDSIVDAIREFIELEEYCSRDAADWLRYQIDLGGEEE